MAAPINNSLPPPTNGSGRRVVAETQDKLSVAGQSADTAASSGTDHIDLSGAGLRLGRAVGAGGGDITTPQAAAAAVANLRQRMNADPAAALAAYGNMRREGLLPAPLA